MRKIKKRNKNKIINLLQQLPQYDKSNIQFGNEYFFGKIGNGGATVCHFKLKNFPNWKFGIWLRSEKVIDFFGDYIDFIDKFKPTQSSISTRNFTIFKTTINSLIKNEELFFDDLYGLRDGFKQTQEKKLQNIKNDIKYHQEIRKILKNMMSKFNIDKIYIEDKDYGYNSSSSPRYVLCFLHKGLEWNEDTVDKILNFLQECISCKEKEKHYADAYNIDCYRFREIPECDWENFYKRKEKNNYQYEL